jgi:proline dehydrogenase
LQLLYNTPHLNVVFNTFQTYLQTTEERLKHEIRMHQHLGTHPAVKLVRGAYMVEESQLAAANHYPNPICHSY